MNIYRVQSLTSRQKIAEVSSYQEARSYLSKIGDLIAFEGDTAAGGADALVIPHGSRIAEQFDIGI